ncbi:MAG: peptidase M14 [Acidobacteria bacterium]|nr:peptidase M14 [Acidobacteriota bacterium]
MITTGRPLRRFLAGAVLALAAAHAASAELPYGDAVAARFAAPAVRYDTPGLQPGRDSYTGNDELRAVLRELAARPLGPRLLAAGRSAGGEAIEALHYTRGPGRPAVLLVGQQHGDEPAGSEALLAVARLLSGPELSPLLERIDVVVLPRANPDGAALAVRRGLHGLDINRDHLLLRTPEAQAQALLVRALRPLVVVDAHEHVVIGRYLEKFNAIQRHDLPLQYAMVANLPAELMRASETWFRQPLLQALAREGPTVEWYYQPDDAGDLRLSMGGVARHGAQRAGAEEHDQHPARIARHRHRPPAPGAPRAQPRRRRAQHPGTALPKHAGALQALRGQVETQVAGSACRGDLVVLAAQTPTRRDVLMLDPASGADKSVAVHWNSSLELRPLIQRPRPCGYWLAAEAGDAVQRLQALGVTVLRLAEATEAAGQRPGARSCASRRRGPTCAASSTMATARVWCR